MRTPETGPTFILTAALSLLGVPAPLATAKTTLAPLLRLPELRRAAHTAMLVQTWRRDPDGLRQAVQQAPAARQWAVLAQLALGGLTVDELMMVAPAHERTAEA